MGRDSDNALGFYFFRARKLSDITYRTLSQCRVSDTASTGVALSCPNAISFVGGLKTEENSTEYSNMNFLNVMLGTKL
ncbi:Uncharacterised protein [Serratia fonticola]|nr:Uncharacterised protein [Serratia fonticola]